MLKAVDLYKSYGNIEVLKGVSLEINKGEISAKSIFGEGSNFELTFKR